MERTSWRWLAAAAVTIGGVAAAILAGAPLPATLLALLAGIAAFALIPAPRAPPPPELPTAADGPDEPLPGMAELLRAVEEPLLIVRDRRVIAANAAAREVLGDHGSSLASLLTDGRGVKVAAEACPAGSIRSIFGWSERAWSRAETELRRGDETRCDQRR